MDGVHLNAGAGKNHAIQFAGLEIVPAALSESPTTRPAAAPSPARADPAASQPALADTLATYPVSIAQIEVKNIRASFDDQSAVPPTQLAFEVSDFTLKNITTDPKGRDSAIDIRARMGAPGIIKTISVDGQLTPFAAKKTLRLTVSADGIDPRALKPYLDTLGLESELHAGTFSADILGQAVTGPDGLLSMSGQLTKLRFAQDSVDLLAMTNVQIQGAGFDTKSGLFQVDSIDVSGPGLYRCAATRVDSSPCWACEHRINQRPRLPSPLSPPASPLPRPHSPRHSRFPRFASGD